MTERRLHVSPGAAATAVVALLFIGAGGTYLLMRDGSRQESSPLAPDATGATAAASPARDVVVILTPEAIDRAGITVAQVTSDAPTAGLRVPGVVEPNAYRQVSVTPVVAGRIVRVSAQLGDRVRTGQSVAQVYSPEVAEARTKYVAATSMLDAHDRELQRTQKLVEIGAASRQELERIHAEHAAQLAEVESAVSRLRLLGVDGASVANAEAATANVPAPIDGVVTERLANVGVNVDPTTKLFTIVDLSTVWIVADVYERDLQRVRTGGRALVTTTAYPDRPFEGRISYIDPQLTAATRTAKMRVEVPNPRGDLRLGMYADVTLESAADPSTITVPRDAIQNVGNRQVVYLATSTDRGTFAERAVRVGRTFGDRIEILEGVSPGDAVVAKGSFFLRAEAERLGLRGAPPSPGATTVPAAAVEVVKIAVTEKGFEPDRVRVRPGASVRLTFVRTTDKTCGTEVVFPSLNIKRVLPLNEPVGIDLPVTLSGEIAFACGMNMLKGVVVVQ
jgi:cobalt-zinc-cadmium efflux system membrane fusion protein